MNKFLRLARFQIVLVLIAVGLFKDWIIALVPLVGIATGFLVAMFWDRIRRPENRMLLFFAAGALLVLGVDPAVAYLTRTIGSQWMGHEPIRAAWSALAAIFAVNGFFIALREKHRGHSATPQVAQAQPSED